MVWTDMNLKLDEKSSQSKIICNACNKDLSDLEFRPACIESNIIAAF
jgi:hypothetical protein